MDNGPSEAITAVKNALTRSREAVRTKTLDRLSREIRQALDEPPRIASSVYLFGSWATGTFDGYSDVDLLIVAPDDNAASEAQERLMLIGDDVLAVSDAQWEKKVATGEPFWTRIAAQRWFLVDTRAEQNQ